MRTNTQIFVRSGLVAAAAALPLTVAAPSAVADNGITVTSTGSTVSVNTAACPGGGNASLLSSGLTTFTQGRQAALAVGATNQTAAWSNVSPGAYTVIVNCNDGRNVGSQPVTVTTTPTLPTTNSPALGVRGGIGGGIKDYGTLTMVGGGVLVAAALGGGAWYLRRRNMHHRT
ncbi:hypothetical protein H1V43_28710 [Streptomyces sp. PSKA54]|uniref:Secreted protein n=1 Tax=Streptomyces himalayensis subsp. aureolus TaxID=2758039 RepID=A0A7W2HIN9_9ACTN|nr:hypothetical protein [Streptomyces himalayensis]MBA4865262.1 hypothetical protein [Streptomyces himalayensis subsp. aureolus]